MKKILITGANSYIGTSFEKWVSKEPTKYSVDTVDTRDYSWRERDFSPYDVVFHVAGVAHVKETKENEGLYYKVNRDLAYEVAKKAKAEGVKQFIFLSSMSVYGMETGIINEETRLEPTTSYGKSKMEAEELINSLDDEHFKVATIRPPMVYGKGCKGNYTKLAKLAKNTPIFPSFENQRSMIYIDNLCEFIKQLIDDKGRGIYHPQNEEYVNTSEMVKLIATNHKKMLVTTKIFNPVLNILKVNVVNKVFGNLTYDMKLSQYKNNYRVYKFKESIINTEAGN